MLHRLRIKFTKEGDIRFISHLDLVNLFSRAIKRANISIEYSHGFNPRQKIDFSFALPLGMESLCEYADFILTQNIARDIFIKSLSGELDKGINILSAEYVDLNTLSLTSVLNFSRYKIIVSNLSDKFIKENIGSFLNNPDKSVLHWTKKGRVKVDISDIIKDIKFDSDSITMDLKISPQKNIRPQEIVMSIFNVSEKEILSWSFIRMELSQELGMKT